MACILLYKSITVESDGNSLSDKETLSVLEGPLVVTKPIPFFIQQGYGLNWDTSQMCLARNNGSTFPGQHFFYATVLAKHSLILLTLYYSFLSAGRPITMC